MPFPSLFWKRRNLKRSSHGTYRINAPESLVGAKKTSMATYGILGLMGEGKSYCAVWHMLECFEKGVPVASNIRLNPEAVTAYFGGWSGWKTIYRELHIGEVVLDEATGKESMHPDDDPWSWPVGDKRNVAGGTRIAIVLDETGEWLDPDLPGGKGRIGRILSRMRHSDKFGQDWYLIVQDMTHMHRRARRLIKFWWVMRDLGKHRIPFLNLPFPPPARFNFERWKYFGDAKTLVQKRPDWLMKDKRVYACYDTAAVYGETAGAHKMPVEKLERLKGGVPMVYHWSLPALAFVFVLIMLAQVWWVCTRG